jgi:hypothetical protein
MSAVRRSRIPNHPFALCRGRSGRPEVLTKYADAA